MSSGHLETSPVLLAASEDAGEGLAGGAACGEASHYRGEDDQVGKGFTNATEKVNNPLLDDRNWVR